MFFSYGTINKSKHQTAAPPHGLAIPRAPLAPTAIMEKSIKKALNNVFLEYALQNISEIHKETLEACVFHLEDDGVLSIRNIADAEHLRLVSIARREIMEIATRYAIADRLRLYSKDNQPLKSFGRRSIEQESRYRVDMMEVQFAMNTVSGLILPEGTLASPSDIYQFVRYSPKALAATWQGSNVRIALSPEYCKMLNRPWEDHISEDGATNAGRWAEGELERITALLDRHQLIREEEYHAYLWSDPDSPRIWQVSAQQIELGKRKARLIEIHSINQANISMI